MDTDVESSSVSGGGRFILCCPPTTLPIRESPVNVLLVEDDVRFGRRLKSEIEQQSFSVDWVQTCEAGLTAVNQACPDVVLLDLMLPDGSGYGFLEMVRRDHDVPVIVISARSLGEDKVRALDLGADDYLTKPFWANELTARIRAVIRRAGGTSSEVHEFSFGHARVDLTARQLFVTGRQGALTPTEFTLLEFFMKRPNQALRRERIIDFIFTNPDSATEALQTHVSRLRKKLGPQGVSVKTVWGIGYRFEPEA